MMVQVICSIPAKAGQRSLRFTTGKPAPPERP